MRDSFLDPPKRKQNRLQGYDYGRPGYYFITVCAGKRAEFFWEASSMRCVGADIIRPFSPRLSQYGVYVEKAIQDIPQHYTGVKVDKYVVMPNHIHLILTLAWRSGRMISAPTVFGSASERTAPDCGQPPAGHGAGCGAFQPAAALFHPASKAEPGHL